MDRFSTFAECAAVAFNLATHKISVAAKTTTKAGCCFLHLPALQPNPDAIETAFSRLKAHLRKVRSNIQ